MGYGVSCQQANIAGLRAAVVGILATDPAPTTWYRQKNHPSFADALAALRRCLWHKHIFADLQPKRLPSKFIQPLLQPMVEALAYAA